MDSNAEWMRKLAAIIEENLKNPYLTNAQLAQKSGLSERQFYRRVELLTGKSPNHYIREIRLAKAKELLQTGDFFTVKEVAIRVGFLKVSYFSKLFEQQEGRRPIEVLREYL